MEVKWYNLHHPNVHLEHLIINVNMWLYNCLSVELVCPLHQHTQHVPTPDKILHLICYSPTQSSENLPVCGALPMLCSATRKDTPWLYETILFNVNNIWITWNTVPLCPKWQIRIHLAIWPMPQLILNVNTAFESLFYMLLIMRIQRCINTHSI